MKKQILSLIPSLLFAATIFASPPSPFVLKWDISIATPSHEGLVSLNPGAALTLERGKTNDVFAILGMSVPEEQRAHRAISLEFRYRFFQGAKEVANGTIHADQHGVFIPSHPSSGNCDRYRPASQELYSIESFMVPWGADSLVIERAAIDSLSGNTKLSGPARFDLVGNRKSFLVASGGSRGDTNAWSKPFLLGGQITGGQPLATVFDEYRAMNAWVRTETSQLYGNGIIATYAGTDSRTLTCINKNPNLVYYSAWADMPLFEVVTRFRFDGGAWQEFAARKLHPAWASGVTKNLFPVSFDTIPGIFRSADPYVPNHQATVFPQTMPSKLAELLVQDINVPAGAKTFSVQTRIHAYLIAHYGKNFEGIAYVGDDCIKVYADGQRIELQDLWDTPDFTPATEWAFQVR